MSLIQSIDHCDFRPFGIRVSVKRDDLLHPVISGNKWYKLQYHLRAFENGSYEYLASFGGAYSNHIHALAYAGKHLNIPTLGFIRGEQLLPLNPTLRDCIAWGMTLIPLSRKEYKLKHDSIIVKNHLEYYANSYLVPEGGSGLLGVKGAMGIVQGQSVEDFDHIVIAAGTGTSAAGIIASVPDNVHVHVIAVLNAKAWLENEIGAYLSQLGCSHRNWSVTDSYTFGGYAKTPQALLDFMREESSYLLLDPVYTAKAWYALHGKVQSHEIKPQDRVLFIHTGGLQGGRSMHSNG